MKNKYIILIAVQLISVLFLLAYKPLPTVDIILYNGKIITVDKHFTIAEAVAIQHDKIFAVGSNKEIRKLAGKRTKIIDLKGKTVIPGLIDFHAHPEGAAVSELDEQIPDVHNVPDVLSWIKGQTMIKKQG